MPSVLLAQLRQPDVGALAISTAVGIQAVSALNFSYSWAGSPKTGTSAWLTTEGHCSTPLCRLRAAAAIAAALALASASGSGGLTWPRWPLLPHADLAGQQQEAIHAVAQKRPPQFSNHRELIAEEPGESIAGLRSRSSRLTAVAPSIGTSGRVAK